MSDRSRNRERPRAALALLLAGATLLPAATALAADPHTTEAIRQAEEARRAVQWPSPYAWGSPGPWSGWPAYPPAACTPGLPCPSAYPYSPPPVAPYPGAPVAPVMPYPAPPPPAASPYPIPANPAGRVLILVNPVDAEVYVDGVRLQQRSDLSYEVGLLAGPHRVDVKKDGYRPYSRKVDVAPGGGLYLPIGLEQ